MEKFSRYAGGAESYALALAASLIENGWDVHLYGEAWDGKPEAAVFHKIPVPKYLPAWIKMLLFALKHQKAVKNQGFDVIMGFGNTVYMNVYQSHGGVHWLSTKRKVYSEKSTIKRVIKRLLIILSPKQWMRAWIESAPFRCYPRPRIVAISHMIKSDMESYFTIDGKEIDVVYNGVDISIYNASVRQELRGPLRRKLGIKEDEVVFLFVSYDLKKKGIESLVEAVSRVKERGRHSIRLLVVGGRPYRSLERQIWKHHVGNEILFTGPVSSIAEYYANSDVFVLPTYYDACSLVLIEAMACGLPSITTTANGAAGIIADGENGYIIPHPPHTVDLTQKMWLLMDDERRQLISREALRTGQGFSATKNHQKMISILGEVAALRNGSTG